MGQITTDPFPNNETRIWKQAHLINLFLGVEVAYITWKQMLMEEEKKQQQIAQGKKWELLPHTHTHTELCLMSGKIVADVT